MRIILASQSPRRKELLQLAGYDFSVIAATTDEKFPDGMPIAEIPIYIALQKANAIAAITSDEDTIIIAADTIVVFEEEILGKPTDKNEALEMLKKLNGNKHDVYTGVAIKHQDKLFSFFEKTTVFFNELPTEQLQYYIDNFSPLDKAGAYGCQEWIGARAISRIEGDFYNVMGLPVNKVVQIIETISAQCK